MNLARRVALYLRERVQWRSFAAYLLMVLFIALPTVGATQVYAPAGWITAGVLCGIVGYVLGAD